MFTSFAEGRKFVERVCALSDSEIEYSLIGVKNVLSGSFKNHENSKKPETSILLKETISHIYYSNETVAIKFIYPPNPPSNQEEIMGGGGHAESNSHKKATSKGNLATSEPYFNNLEGKSQESKKDIFYEI